MRVGVLTVLWLELRQCVMRPFEDGRDKTIPEWVLVGSVDRCKKSGLLRWMSCEIESETVGGRCLTKKTNLPLLVEQSHQHTGKAKRTPLHPPLLRALGLTTLRHLTTNVTKQGEEQ